MKHVIHKITIGQISHAYRKDEFVLKNVNAVFEKGDSAAIMGTSGVGKTTLLKIMSGLMKPTEGNILFDDINYYNMPEKKRICFRRDNFGFVFQNFELISELTVYENIIFPLLLGKSKTSKIENEEYIDELCSTLALDDLRGRYPSEISGGQQQRTAIARALIRRPEILFCDEPTGNLDQTTSAAVMELLTQINERYHTTFIIVTHDKEIAAKTHRILKMSANGVLTEERCSS